MIMSRNKKPSAIVIEDQPIIWDYAKSCLEKFYEVVAYCSSTKEAEKMIRLYNPDLIWLDCYLGEISDFSQGLKNSGLQLAYWIKSHYPKTKIFLFSASNELSMFKIAQKLGIEGIALGGKFLKDKEIIINGIEVISQGETWLSPDILQNIQLTNFLEITILEFCVLSSLLLGKSTGQIAEDLDLTRKHVNNAIYRVKQKLNLDESAGREELLELVREKLAEAFSPSQYYSLSEMIMINSTVQNYLNPLIEKIKDGDLSKMKIGSIV